MMAYQTKVPLKLKPELFGREKREYIALKHQLVSVSLADMTPCGPSLPNPPLLFPDFQRLPINLTRS